MAEPMRCTCTMLAAATHESPAEWEQDSTCEVHYDRAAVVAMLEAPSKQEARLRRALLDLEAAVTASLTTPEHTRELFAGLPRCSCGLDLNGQAGRAHEVYIAHLLDLAQRALRGGSYVLTNARVHSWGPAADGLGRVTSVDGVSVADEHLVPVEEQVDLLTALHRSVVRARNARNEEEDRG